MTNAADNDLQLNVRIELQQPSRGYNGISLVEVVHLPAMGFLEICEILGKFHELAEKIKEKIKAQAIVALLFVCALTVGAQSNGAACTTGKPPLCVEAGNSPDSEPGKNSADSLTPRPSAPWQPRPSTPWFKSKMFWISTGISAAAAVADGVTTSRALRRCPSCFEQNPVLGARPSRRRVFLIGLASLAAERTVIAFVWSRNEQAGQGMAFTATALRGAYHGVFAHDNSKIKAEPRACPAKGAGCR